MRFAFPVLLALAAVLTTACPSGPVPRYAGPEGEGRLVYDPEFGIVRQGTNPRLEEQALYRTLDEAWNERRWQDVIDLSLVVSDRFPEGSRVVDAIVKRIKARFEVGRNQAPEVGLPRRIMLHQWMFLYLAPIHDDRLQRMLRVDEESNRFIREYRDQDIDTFIRKLAPDADALYDSGQLIPALNDCRDLLTYYLPALELREFRREAAELTRDVAWLMYAARDYSAVVDISLDLRAMNPPPSVKGDSLFILGQAQRQNGAHAIAAQTFGHLFRGAGLRDTDTRWRPYALMWQIHQTMAASKGPIYDLVPYEEAMELLGEYELYMFENPNIPQSVQEEFVLLMEDVYGVMILRALNAADTYGRLGEGKAEEYYLARAEDWEEERDRRIAELVRAQ